MKVKAHDLPLSPGTSILFEPNGDQLELSGLHSHESAVTMLDDGCMLIPLVNVYGTSTCLEEGGNCKVY